VVDAVEKMQPLLGKFDTVTVRYDKVLLVFFRMGNLVVTLSFDPNVTTPFISSLSESMRALDSLYPAGAKHHRLRLVVCEFSGARPPDFKGTTTITAWSE
jgi:hypothetical protein